MRKEIQTNIHSEFMWMYVGHDIHWRVVDPAKIVSFRGIAFANGRDSFLCSTPTILPFHSRLLGQNSGNCERNGSRLVCETNILYFGLGVGFSLAKNSFLESQSKSKDRLSVW